MSKVWVLQHTEKETLGRISEALERRGMDFNYIRSFMGQPVPREMGDAVGLIVLGGPMGVYEQQTYPYLTDEMRLIEKALQQERPVLGICLGSQLLASALGADVRKGARKEVGWHPIAPTGAGLQDRLLRGLPDSFMAFHWHGDVFDLPKDAVALASSEWTEHQAFSYGDSAYGFLFHMEVTEEIIRGMVATFPEEIEEAGEDSSDVILGIARYIPTLQREIGGPAFARWADLLRGDKAAAGEH